MVDGGVLDHPLGALAADGAGVAGFCLGDGQGLGGLDLGAGVVGPGALADQEGRRRGQECPEPGFPPGLTEGGRSGRDGKWQRHGRLLKRQQPPKGPLPKLVWKSADASGRPIKVVNGARSAQRTRLLGEHRLQVLADQRPLLSARRLWVQFGEALQPIGELLRAQNCTAFGAGVKST